MTNKILTIAVPCYNVEQYLEKGLPTYCDPRLADGLEVLLVNDGSSDRTEGIALSFEQRYPSIFRVITKENGGHGSAINAGLEHATGRYFRIVDGDDWVHTENLISLIDLLREIETDLVIDVKNEVHMVTGETELFPIPDYVPKNQACAFDDICSRDDIGSFIMIHTMNAKTDLLRSIDLRLLEHTFYVDYEYIVKATSVAQTVEFIDLEICQYQVGNVNQSVSDENYVRRWADHSRVTEETLRFVSERIATGGLSQTRREYLERKATLIINTHYNIALIFDSERKRGAQRAKEFRAFLRKHYPRFAEATEKRYRQALILHHAGFDSQARLDSLRRG